MKKANLGVIAIAISFAFNLSVNTYASPWIAVDCEGQTEALMERVMADENIALTADGQARLRAHSLAVCSGDGTAATPIKKKKGILNFGDDSEAGKKPGNKRLDRF